MKLFFILIFLVAVNWNGQSQKTIEGISNTISINITKDPPVLLMVEGSLKFKDPNGNNAIDANEQAIIAFEVQNRGKGHASGLVAQVRELNKISGLVFDKAISLGGVSPGSKKIIDIPVSGNISLTNGTASFIIKLDEEDGFGLDEVELDVKTLSFVSPQVKIPDYSITSDYGSSLSKKKPFDLQVVIQNLGKGMADQVNVSLKVPENVLCLSDNITSTFTRLNSGETQTLIYSLIVNEKYTGNNIPVEIKINERYGKYAENKTINLQLNQSMAMSKLIVESKTRDDNTIIKEASLSSDVDKNIPESKIILDNTYVLIIGNEDYSSYQNGLSREINVDFAINDARIFKIYCERTLGIPERHIKIYSNATTGFINQGLDWISAQARANIGAKLIVYYSGHGLPDPQTKDPYIIPVDVNGNNISLGIPLSHVYNKLNEYPTQKVTVILDACFSGGARNKGLIAMKGVKVKPKDQALNGNMVVFASSSGEESSGVYREKQHGYLTYYLLKKLQESKGEVTYQHLFDYIKYNVGRETALVGTIQTPNVIVSPKAQGVWTGWKLKQ